MWRNRLRSCWKTDSASKRWNRRCWTIMLWSSWWEAVTWAHKFTAMFGCPTDTRSSLAFILEFEIGALLWLVLLSCSGGLHRCSACLAWTFQEGIFFDWPCSQENPVGCHTVHRMGFGPISSLKLVRMILWISFFALRLFDLVSCFDTYSKPSRFFVSSLCFLCQLIEFSQSDCIRANGTRKS